MSLLPPLLAYSEEPRPTPVAATGFSSTDAAQSQLSAYWDDDKPLVD